MARSPKRLTVQARKRTPSYGVLRSEEARTLEGRFARLTKYSQRAPERGSRSVRKRLAKGTKDKPGAGVDGAGTTEQESCLGKQSAMINGYCTTGTGTSAECRA